MTITPERRKLLPLFPTPTRHGSRSYMTCHYRCGNACDQPIPNQSENGHIQSEINKAIGRRSVLKGAAVGSGALMVGSLAGTEMAAAAPAEPALDPVWRGTGDLSRAAFTPVQPNKRDALVVPDAFHKDVLIRWGDQVEKGSPRFDVRNQTPESAKQQFGYNNDYVGVVETGRNQALLCVNHEYTDEQLMFPTGMYDENTIKEIAMASHGFSVVTIRRGKAPGSWLRVKPSNTTKNRRIHTGTPFRIVGPAAGHELLQTSIDPSGTVVRGTLGNCAGGTTPWGTILSGEENFNGYFDASGSVDPEHSEAFGRYGLNGSGRGWSDVDERFDLSKEPKEANKFGWIVEIDPLQPNARPVKHTMLGRFKHEGANCVVDKFRKVVVYMGDDERGDYIYKFVSRGKFDPANTMRARQHNKKLLHTGTLFVARFTGDGEGDGVYDGTGQWIALCNDERSFVRGMSVEEVLINTRLAADKVSPTKMDRPEDIEPNPVNGKVYCALTNNSQRGSTHARDEANPITSSHVRSELGAPLTQASGNRNGYVLEITPKDGVHTNKEFVWDLMLVCGDPEAQETYFAGFDKSRVSPISCPDNVAFDKAGNLWISTDGNVLGSNDGIFRVPVAGKDRGNVRQFLTVPRGSEACGPLISEDDKTLFLAVQHPGEVDGATFENPASTWPHSNDFPRPSVCTVYRRS